MTMSAFILVGLLLGFLVLKVSWKDMCVAFVPGVCLLLASYIFGNSIGTGDACALMLVGTMNGIRETFTIFCTALALSLIPAAFLYIKGKNAEQRCALDALNDDKITAVALLGTYGSGKTMLATAMALDSVKRKGTQSKILCVREAWGEGREIGFLPGDVSDKIGLFQLPFIQQLNGGEFEYKSLVQQGVIDSTVLYYMKGTTYNETVMLCDEAEDLTEKQIKLVGTRVGTNSKIYFSGDYKQSLLDSTEFNPLLRMCEKLKGNPLFACVYLSEDVRSETSKMFADLFD